MATYEVRLPTGHVVTRTVPDGASDEVVRKVFADEMRRAGINVDEQQVVRRKTLGDLANENKKPTLKDGFQGEITTPQRNVSGRVSDYINAALVEAGVDERYAAHLSGRVESFLGDLTPTGNLDGLLYGHSDLERQLSILPIPGPERKAIIKGIRAWHGSPHDFDKFSLSKIGTGEGAQAYGHGLYFAENKNVAADYRNTLAQPKINGREMRLPEGNAWGALNSHGGDLNKALASLEAEISAGRANGAHPLDLEPLQDEAGVLRAWQKYGLPEVTNTGRLYEVNINAKPEDFLDYDAPLKAQSQKVQRAATATQGLIGPFSPDATGANLINYFSNVDRLVGLPKRPEQLMREQGIPGIRYLDQGSRTAGQGSRNYVVFDDSLIDILNKY